MKQTFSIEGKEIDSLELLGMLEDCDSSVEWTVTNNKEEIEQSALSFLILQAYMFSQLGKDLEDFIEFMEGLEK